MRYDIAIVGTGPAGISAAITSKIRNKNIILLGSKNLSDKLSKAHEIDNYPGFPHIAGAELAANLTKHVESLGIEITEKRVSTVYTMGDYFTLQADSDMIEASAVILAGGIVQGKSLEGEDNFVGRGVSYCATCDGRLYTGKKVAVLGYTAEAVEEAEYLSEIVGEVEYYAMNKSLLPKEKDNLKIINEIPKSIKGSMKADSLVTDKAEHEVDCVFVLRDAIQPSQLAPGIETDGPHIKVNLQMETNIKGLFACGDIAGKPYQYIKSAGQGNIAALSAVSYLSSLKHGA